MRATKLTKTELRLEQHRLKQLEKYLPTIRLKKALLQAEVQRAVLELKQHEERFYLCAEKVELFAALFTAPESFVLMEAIRVVEVRTGQENIAGVEMPVFEKVEFAPLEFPLFALPVWMEFAVNQVQELILVREKIKVAKLRLSALEGELKEVSIRVNLFEKIMIPRTQEKIKKIKVFLGDQELSAVCRAKVSKEKILSRKRVAVP